MAIPQTIAREFRDFYDTLYNIPPANLNPDGDPSRDYLTTSTMPTLPAEARNLLEEPITLQELQMALGNTKPGKAPGPDGLTVAYYRALLPALGTRMVELFNGLGTGEKLHVSTLQAQIAIIPKEGKDPSQCGSYRPISLLNVDLKLLTKIVATRIQQHLTGLIQLDQVGFVATREARDNTVKVLNLLHVVKTTKTPCDW